ncbi:uncharacterized protein BN750_00698 [Bacteroides sp. CAG:661]|nr:uncharacterized protein BN750_00698 [Bacteroides sp. CAG:661]
MKVIITAPSLNSAHNVGGISSVTQFIISNNPTVDYIHFELGKRDNEKRNIIRIFKLIKDWFKWINCLKHNKDAVIHYNFALSKPSILRDPLFFFPAYWMNRHVIIHVHGGIFLTAPHIPQPFCWILNKVFCHPFSFIVLSEQEKKTIKQKFQARYITVLPNCIDLKDAELFARKEPHENKPITIGYIGRIASTKGMDYLLKACVTLKEQNIPFSLKLAGSEEIHNQYIPQFKSILNEQFEYCGIVSGSSKTEFLKTIDVFVLPSFFEGLPMSLLECMSYGIVPITTNVGSISEYVQDGQNGIFIKVKDSQTIVEAILKLVRNKKLISEYGNQAKATVFSRLSPGMYIDNLNKLYQGSPAI